MPFAAALPDPRQIMTTANATYFQGTFMHTPRPDQLEVLQDALVAVDAHGIITSVSRPADEHHAEHLLTARQSGSITTIGNNDFFLPGLVDTHIHAPQWPQLGKALHLPLENWLMDCTFPLEARYSDDQFATAVYQSLVSTLLANGTTSAVYFATVHSSATEILARLCVELGQRAWVGRVAMDDSTQCPDYYRDASTEHGLVESENLIHRIRSLPGNRAHRVKPILTPRFIPSCTDEMLTGLGQLAATHDCHVQTHCSESDWEHQYVYDRLGMSDTEALDGFGLLTRRTVLAHANLLSDNDMHTIKRAQAGIAHCPLSNQYFSGCVFPLRKALNLSLHVGLGTDISGGPSASMFDSCRHTIGAARMLESGVDPSLTADARGTTHARIDYLEAFHLATVGGATMLDEPVGLFRPGYHFDALHINPDATHSNLLYFPDLDSHADLFQKTLYAATRVNIAAVWVNARPAPVGCE